MEEQVGTVDELLRIRESRALRVPVTVRILFSLYGILSVFSSPWPFSSRLIVLSITLPFIAANSYFIKLLRDATAEKVRFVGITGVVLDSITIIYYSFLLYFSFYNTSMPPAIITQIPVLLAVYIVIIVINSLALRSAYTLTVTFAAIAVHMGLIILSVNHPDVTWAYYSVNAVTESLVSLRLVVNNMVFLGIVGCALAWLAHGARKTIIKAAELEAERIHIVRQQANLLLESRLGVLGDMVAGISHEMNNPLGAVKANAETWRLGIGRIRDSLQKCAESGLADGKTEKILNTLENTSRGTYDASERMGSTLKTLRSFARLDEAEFKMVDIHEAIENTLTFIPPETAGKAGVKKQYGNLPEIRAYAGRLNQVFMTLLTNTFKEAADNGEVFIKTESDGKKITIQINDPGREIKEDRLKRIFDINMEAKESRVAASFGMAACQNIIRQHNGRIDVESSRQTGTTFTIELPVS